MKHSSDQKMHNQIIIASLMENPGLVFDKLWRMNNLYWIITKDMKKEEKGDGEKINNLKVIFQNHAKGATVDATAEADTIKADTIQDQE